MISESVWRRAVEIHLFGHPLQVVYRLLERRAGLASLVELVEVDHAEPDLCLAVAARLCGVERNHLNVRLRRATGLTFHRLLTRRRLLAAVERLHRSQADLLQVALDSGFGSLSSFGRNFARAFGMPPDRYRRLLRSAPPRPAAGVNAAGGISARPLFPDFRRKMPD